MADVRQRAKGSNINQAGRDIHITAPHPVVTDSLIYCPECQQLVSRYADNCLACGFPVQRYFTEILLHQRQKRNERIIVTCSSIGIIGGTAMLYSVVPDVEWKIYIPFLGAGLLIASLAYRRLIRKLAEWGL